MVFLVIVLTIGDVDKRKVERIMKAYFCLLCALLFLANCAGRGKSIEQTTNPEKTGTPCQETVISKETAILIAKGDALREYNKLSDYDITVEDQPNAWRIVFKLKDPGMVGGGPDYLIDKKTGKILKAAYYK